MDFVTRHNEKRDVAARLIPFALFVVRLVCYAPLFSLLQDAGIEGRFAYGILLAPVIAGLVYFWPHYSELKFPPALSLYGWLRSVIVGLLVFMIWILPYPEWLNVGSDNAGFSLLSPNGSVDPILLIIRFAGLSLVVPLIEELFWRSFILRWLDQPNFLQMPPAQISNRALIIVAVLFGMEHNLILAGFIAGLCYNWLYRKEGSLYAPLLAHMLTNSLLGILIVYSHAWQYW